MLRYLRNFLNPQAVNLQLRRAVALVDDILESTHLFSAVLLNEANLHCNKKVDLETELIGSWAYKLDSFKVSSELIAWKNVVFRLLSESLTPSLIDTGSASRETFVTGASIISDRVSHYTKVCNLSMGKNVAIDLLVRLVALIDIRRPNTLPIFRASLFPIEKLDLELANRFPNKQCGHWPDPKRDDYVSQYAENTWPLFDTKFRTYFDGCRHLPDPTKTFDSIIATASLLSRNVPRRFSQFQIDLDAVKLIIISNMTKVAF